MNTAPQVSQLTPAARAILDTAGRIFYDRGISAVGVDTLAAEAGVTKKTLYDQFGSKATLVAAYLGERDRHFRDWIEREIQGKDAETQVLAVFDALGSWMDAHSPKGCAFVHAHGALLNAPDHPAHNVIRGEKVWLRTKFEHLVRAAGRDQQQSLATQLAALLEGATVLRSLADMPDAVDEARDAADVLLDSPSREGS
ncbi:TetR/AcrR family transcriptional regulator [Streptomyces xiaopingdaonensis]|uniref:TetR/AcrR family transcriptional regulator n=1 Tax=Streptomyces xiaopingdaonensis TaxID=1565415 RepID=UPI000493E90A|nr:TetR/AcrR family transcriptional regulator [Streptomyces xiaopingdaonensis]